MIRRILVTLSANAYTEAAVRHAIELARTHGSRLIGVTDVNTRAIENVGPVPIGGGRAAHDLVEYRRETVAAHIDEAIGMFESACSAAAIDAEVHQEDGQPFDQILKSWRYCDLTVSGLQGLFGYDVLRSPKDVLIRLIGGGIRPIIAVAPEYRQIDRVMVAFNGSVESSKAMKRFVQSRLWPDASLVITTFDGTDEPAIELAADAADYCRDHGYEVQTKVVDAHPRDALLPTCEEIDADMIVMGSTARARIVKRLLGDTALKAIETSTVPLFLAQ